jgi:hypothetical protein
MSDKPKKIQDILGQITGEDVKIIQEAVAEMVDDISEQCSKESSDRLAALSDQAKRAMSQRDEFMKRAQFAEGKASEAISENERLTAEAGELQEKANRVEALEKERDALVESKEALESDLREEYDKRLRDEIGSKIKKISEFIEGRFAGVRAEVMEEVSRDPRHIAESAAYRQIAEIIAGKSSKDTAATIVEASGHASEEVAALKTHIKMLESRNAKLKAEASKGTQTTNENITESASAPKTKRDSLISAIKNVIECGDMSLDDLEPDTVDSIEKAEKLLKDKNASAEELRNVLKELLNCTEMNMDDMFDSTVKAGKKGQKALDMTEAKKTEAKAEAKADVSEDKTVVENVVKKSRASELLKEFASRPEGEKKDQDWVIPEGKAERIERSNRVMPIGMPVGVDDLIKERYEDKEPSKKKDGDDKPVKGTGGVPRSEIATLSGIKKP